MNGVWGKQTLDETVNKEFEDDKDDDSEWCLGWTEVG